MLSLLFCVLSGFVSFCAGQGGGYRGVFDFCRRFGHMTAEVKDTLYLNGGFMNRNPMSQWPQNRSSECSPELSGADLKTTSW
jgi:hypothetical protein